MLREWPARPVYMAEGGGGGGGGSRVQIYKEPLQRGLGDSEKKFQRQKRSDMWKNTGRQTVFEVGRFRKGLIGPASAAGGGGGEGGPPSPGPIFERCAAGEDSIGQIHMTRQRLSVVRKDSQGVALPQNQQGVRADEWLLTYTFDASDCENYEYPFKLVSTKAI